MSLRGLVIAVVVLAALGGGLWWSKRHPKAEESKTEPAPKVLAVPEDQIAQLELVRKDAPPVVVKKNSAGKWELTAPKTLPVDSDAVQGITGTLNSLSADQVVEEKAGDL